MITSPNSGVARKITVSCLTGLGNEVKQQATTEIYSSSCKAIKATSVLTESARRLNYSVKKIQRK
jgi:hypothetical protein